MYIVHLSHSGFLIVDEGDCLLFDPVSPFHLPQEYERILIFASHAHGDHFKPEYFEEFYGDQKVHFIFSQDIEEVISKEPILNLHILDHYQEVQIDDISIRSYGTTDAGNSYLVSANGKNYFHSGDLNWWHWKRMNDEELKVEERDYKREVNELKDKSIDYAFVPVDPRLEEHGYLAINYFVEVVKPKFVIPMHSFGEYDFYKNLEKQVNLKDTVLLNVHGGNQKIQI